MIYIITSVIGEKKIPEIKRFYEKMQAVAHYRMRVRELAFPDTIAVEILKDEVENG